MTESRIIEIINQHGGYSSQKWAIEAMKQAVNEALDEAAEKASVCEITDYGDNLDGDGTNYYCVNLSSILNLKVK